MTLLQPPSILAKGFYEFAESIRDESEAQNKKLSLEDICNRINSNSSNKVRTNFLLWVINLNKILEYIEIIICDLNSLKQDKHSLNGNPIVRSEFLFQAFFGEFYKLKEISKSYISTISKVGILNNTNKKVVIGFYYEVFEHLYEWRNIMTHQGVIFNSESINLDISMLENLTNEDKIHFSKLIEQSNTRDNTIEIQCAFFLKIINESVDQFILVQNKIMEFLSELIILHEEMVASCTD